MSDPTALATPEVYVEIPSSPVRAFPGRFRLRKGKGALWAVASLTLLSSCASPGAPVLQSRPATPATVTLAPVAGEAVLGEWEGIFYAYPEPMGLVLTLTGTSGSILEGEVRFHPLLDRRRAMAAPGGRFAVRGEYDALLRTFELNPTQWIERSGSANSFRLEGVMDPDAPALAGLFEGAGDRMYFVLTRPNGAEGLRRAMGNAAGRPGSSSPLASLFSRRPDDATLLEWASRLTEEFPDVDPRRTEMGRLYSMAVNLFEDEHFSARFGKTFDQMSAQERAAAGNRFRATISTARPGTIAERLERRPDEGLREYGALSRAFTSSGTQGTAEVMQAVLGQRVIRSWRRFHLARMERLPATSDAILELDRLEAVAAPRLRTLWPSDRTAFAVTLDGKRRDLAGPVLHLRADEAVASAQGYEGARALAAWASENGRLLSLAAQAEGRAALAKVEARLDDLVAPLIAAEVARMPPLGGGWAAVAAGNDWYLQFRTRFGFVSGRTVYQDALRPLLGARPAHLAEARPQIESVIQELSRPEAVDAFVADVLILPGDRDTPAGRAIVGAAVTRKADLEREAERRFLTWISGGVALFCHLGVADAVERQALIPSFLWGWCRREALNFIVEVNLPDLTPAQVSSLVTRMVLFLDGDLRGAATGRDNLVDRFVQDLRTEHPELVWQPTAIEALADALTQWAPR